MVGMQSISFSGDDGWDLSLRKHDVRWAGWGEGGRGGCELTLTQHSLCVFGDGDVHARLDNFYFARLSSLHLHNS